MFSETKGKEKQGTRIIPVLDLTLFAINSKTKWNKAFTALSGKSFYSGILYPTKLAFKWV